MHSFSTSSRGLIALTLAVCAGAVAQTYRPPLVADGGLQGAVAKGDYFAADRAQVASETYLGMLACPNCAGIRVELALYNESGAGGGDPVHPAAYHMRETHLGSIDGDGIVETNGVWTEQPDPQNWRRIIILASGRPDGLMYFASAPDNQGTLLLLDSQFHELPADVPHSIARITGNRQQKMIFLTEADSGRTIDMKPGEVFLLRLKGNPRTQSLWTSNRPASMALLETGSEVAETIPAAPVPVHRTSQSTSRLATAQPLKTTSVTAEKPAAPRYDRSQDEGYQVWQLIAPQSGYEDLRFELRHPNKAYELPQKIVTFTIVVR
jgi:predicted secreted protein